MLASATTFFPESAVSAINFLIPNKNMSLSFGHSKHKKPCVVKMADFQTLVGRKLSDVSLPINGPVKPGQSITMLLGPGLSCQAAISVNNISVNADGVITGYGNFGVPFGRS